MISEFQHPFPGTDISRPPGGRVGPAPGPLQRRVFSLPWRRSLRQSTATQLGESPCQVELLTKQTSLASGCQGGVPKLSSADTQVTGAGQRSQGLGRGGSSKRPAHVGLLAHQPVGQTGSTRVRWAWAPARASVPSGSTATGGPSLWVLMNQEQQTVGRAPREDWVGGPGLCWRATPTALQGTHSDRLWEHTKTATRLQGNLSRINKLINARLFFGS